MSMLNRRNALTAVATLPALAVPAAADASSPDTELLALGCVLDQVIREYKAQVSKGRHDGVLFDAELERVTGIAREEAAGSFWSGLGCVCGRDTPSE